MSKNNPILTLLKTLFHWIIGLALLPLTWAVLKHFGLMVPLVAKEGVRAWGLYVVGLLMYAVISRFVHKPMWFYVWGHELTHALSGILSGAKIHSIKAGSGGGEVRLSKANAFVALSPYIFPFYTLMTMVIYAILQKWWPHPFNQVGFQILVGFTLAFHFSLTWEAIHNKQPDLKTVGFFLSAILILLGNTLIMSFIAVNLFQKTPTNKKYLQDIFSETLTIWIKTYEGVVAAKFWVK